MKKIRCSKDCGLPCESYDCKYLCGHIQPTGNQLDNPDIQGEPERVIYI